MPRPFEIQHRVTFEETNLVGNVYFAHYLRWQGHCREEFLIREAPGVMRQVKAGSLALVTVSCAMSYLSECFAGDEVTIRMRLERVGSYRIGMSFEFLCEESLVATGEQEVACMTRDASGGLALAGPPEDLSRALARYGMAASGRRPWT